MAYGEFTLSNVEARLGVTINRASLFPTVEALPVTSWLQEALDKAKQQGFLSEKARSEFIVAPVLLTSRELTGERFAIFSGPIFIVDVNLGLAGECDFILTHTPSLPVLKAPIMALLEAKKQDIEEGLGQCIAQTVAARMFNQRTQPDDAPIKPVFGCVTTGEDWQFFKLDGNTVWIDDRRYFINEVGKLLGIFKAVVDHYEN
jgi:hypothetical protein